MKNKNIMDDRKESHRDTHKCYVKCRNGFESGWGNSRGGKSYTVWACLEEDVDTVMDWVEKRRDSRAVNIIDEEMLLLFMSNSKNHIKIYAVDKNHKALKGKSNA